MRTQLTSAATAVLLALSVLVTATPASAMTSTLFNATNVKLPTAPASYFEPGAAGVPVPVGFKYWRLTIDQTNVPASSSYAFEVQFLIDGVWQDDAGGTFSGGQVTHKVVNPDGSVSFTTDFINSVSSSIGALDSNGNLVGSYPTMARIRVDSMNRAWAFPSITLVLSDIPFTG